MKRETPDTRRKPGSAAAAAALFAGASETARRCRDLDWSGTPLGAVEDWPGSLRSIAGTVVASPLPMAVLWGPELVQIFNDAFREASGPGRTAALGEPVGEAWREAWRLTDEVREAIVARGESFVFHDQPRDGDGGENPGAGFFRIGYGPVRGAGGEVRGVLVTVLETTAQTRARTRAEERRELMGAELESERARRVLALEVAQLGDWELDLRTQEAPRRSLHHDRIFGYATPHPNWSFDVFLDHVHPDDRARVADAFRTAVGTGVPWDFECRIFRTDEALRWIWARGETQRDAAGEPIRMLGVVSDISARKEAEQALRRAAEADAFRVALGDVLRPLTDPAEIQAAAARVLGKRLGATRVHYGEVTDDGEYGVVRADYCDGVPSVVGRHRLDDYGPAVMDVFRSGRTLVISDVSRDPRLTPAERAATAELEIGAYVIVPLVKNDRAVAVFVVHQATARTWTPDELTLIEETAERTWQAVERGQAESALREAKEVAEQANRAKSEFLAVMSHELRTPLNAISGYADILEMQIHGPVNEAQREALERIQSSQQHLLGLINDVLNYARLESGTVAFDIMDVRVCDLLSSARQLVEPQVRAKSLSLAVESCPTELAVRVDQEKLLQILVNLLSNAVKFTDRFGRIALGCEVDGDRIRVHLTDTGIGIPDDRLDSIFEPFVQVRSDLTRTAEGTGLGLAISRDLARGMGGDLTVRSELGKGSTFTLTLPRAADRSG